MAEMKPERVWIYYHQLYGPTWRDTPGNPAYGEPEREFVSAEKYEGLRALVSKTAKALEDYSSGDCYLDECAEELKAAIE